MESVEYEKRKQLLEVIKRFSRSEQEEVYRILRRKGEVLSENRNGIFFDLMVLKQETINVLYDWISYCEKNKEILDKRSEEMDKLRKELKEEHD